VVPKSPEAVVKKPASRASKRLNKASAASTSLDAHRLTSSDDDVSILFFLQLTLFELSFLCLTLADFNEKVHFFGH
jgi:hypothetical protein